MASLLTPLLGGQADPVASILLERFGTLANILGASPEALRGALRSQPDIAEALVACQALLRIGSLEQLVGEPVQVGDTRLSRYLVAELQNPSEERLQAIFLDESNRYIRDERICQGTRDALSLRMRHLLHRALDLGASGLIVAHNHPSGSAQPSARDYEATRSLEAIAAPLDIRLLDHCIVARGKVYSMALERFL